MYYPGRLARKSSFSEIIKWKAKCGDRAERFQMKSSNDGTFQKRSSNDGYVFKWGLRMAGLCKCITFSTEVEILRKTRLPRRRSGLRSIKKTSDITTIKTLAFGCGLSHENGKKTVKRRWSGSKLNRTELLYTSTTHACNLWRPLDNEKWISETERKSGKRWYLVPSFGMR